MQKMKNILLPTIQFILNAGSILIIFVISLIALSLIVPMKVESLMIMISIFISCLLSFFIVAGEKTIEHSKMLSFVSIFWGSVFMMYSFVIKDFQNIIVNNEKMINHDLFFWLGFTLFIIYLLDLLFLIYYKRSRENVDSFIFFGRE